MMKKSKFVLSFALLLAIVVLASCSAPSSGAGQAKASAWANTNIGDITVAGNFSNSADGLDIKGAGREIGSFEDGFHYVYKTLKGNGSLVAKLDQLQDTNPWATAGIMMRSSLNSDASHSMIGITPGNGIWFTYRIENEIESESNIVTMDTSYKYIKLERSGDDFISYISSDGQTWTEAFRQLIPMNEEVYIGFAVSSNNEQVLTDAQFSAVTASGLISASVDNGKDINSEAISLPISLRNNGKYEAASISMDVEKPAGVSSAKITLTAFDPDFDNEGELYINDNGPIQLFGQGAGGRYDVRVEDFTYDVPVDWFKNGSNSLKFVHTRTGGFRIDAIKVAFDGKLTKPAGLDSFPISLTRQAPESKLLNVNISKVDGAKTAILDMSVWDADNANEGELYVNGNGPITLFGDYSKGGNDSRTISVSFSMSADWWQDGNNTLKFVHTRTGGFRVERASIRFDNSASSDPNPTPGPTPTPDPSPTPEPTPTPTPTPSGLLPKPGIPSAPSSATYYVSTSGNNNNNGRSTGSPFRTIGKAVSVARAGDVIFVRGGKYRDEDIRFKNSGNSNARITVMSYPGEWAVIDWSNKRGGRDKNTIWFDGADYITMRDMEIYRAPAQCVFLHSDADHNVFVNMVFNSCWGSGFQIFKGSYNIVAYSVAKNNYGGGNSDGFGSIGVGGTSVYNEFWYNVADHNSDDGFDAWKGQHNLYFGNVSRYNGYSGGDGNGFKLGSSGVNGQNIARRNIAYGNKYDGFDTNIGGGNIIENNTGFNNSRHNFESSRVSQSNNIFKNNLSINGSVGMYGSSSEQNNSWNLKINNAGVMSTDPNSNNFLALSSGSAAIDKGVKIDLPFKGSAPDLGALEQGLTITQLYSN
ncbi:MAG: DUF1565 domain-containing protein [Trueperaceae bacterium]|nr:DUF1565 domain-containing protein [Trueperaceae bacterium]